MQTQAEVKSSFNLLVLSSVLTLVLWFIPYAEIVTFPLRLFVTYIHEVGHALAALASFGSVHQIELYLNGSGVTETLGGTRLLISSAGYLSTTLFGSGLLLLLRRQRNAKGVAIAVGALLLVVTVLFGGNALAWAAGLVMGGGLILMAAKASPKITHFVMSFLGIQLVLNAFYDLRTLMYLSAFNPELSTDAQNMAEATGGWVPAMAWAIGWSIISTVILIATMAVYYRSLRNRAENLALPPIDLSSGAFLPDSTQSGADRMSL